ncbi:Conserved_hypothetical protein [Hexamita inflata]|uniref:Transmembrane protein n=1 Tax=Hexamita inflata TaxID=28002 RepID=A0AA86PTE9_9EUKA|nr:Conserved hypothetical protein [Hexamita inflata]
MLTKNDFNEISVILTTQTTLTIDGTPTVYNQSVICPITNIHNSYQDDCFDTVKISYYDKFIHIQAQTGALTHCSINLFGQFNYVNLTISAAKNQDFSDFVFEESLQINYTYGDKLDLKINCSMVEQQNRCYKLFPQLKQLPSNSTNMISLQMKLGAETKYKMIILPHVMYHQYDNVMVVLRDKQLCVQFDGNKNQTVEFHVDLGHDFIQHFSAALSQDYLQYCNLLNETEWQKAIELGEYQIDSIVSINGDVIYSTQSYLYLEADTSWESWITWIVIMVAGLALFLLIYRKNRS